MSFGGGFFGSGEKNVKETTNQVTQTQDQRVTLADSEVGTIISPGATVTGGAGLSISAQPQGTATVSHFEQSIVNSGYTAGDVSGMLSSMFNAGSADRAAIGDLAGSLSSQLAAQNEQLGQIVGATRAPEQSSLTAVVPWLLLGFFLFLVMK
jgi:hypothetical protein